MIYQPICKVNFPVCKNRNYLGMFRGEDIESSTGEHSKYSVCVDDTVIMFFCVHNILYFVYLK